MSSIIKPRAAIYARYSTDKQNKSSIEDQIRVCARLCDQRGFAQVETYSDAAVSGATLARPELKRLIADAEASQFDVIVLDSLSRLSRDPADMHMLFRRLQYFGIKIVTVAHGDADLMQVGLQGTVSGLSLQATSRETFRNHESKVLKGRIMGGLCYGYKPVRAFDGAGKPVTGEREIVPEEAENVVRIFREYAEGKSAKAVAAGLNRDGIKGPRGGIWRQNTINGNRKRGTGILNNELYAGVYVWNRQTFKTKPSDLIDLGGTGGGSGRPRTARPNAESSHIRTEIPHLAIVPKVLWEAVKARQAALDAKVDSQQKSREGKNRRAGIGAARRPKHALSGLLVCDLCGGRMTASGGQYVRCATAAETGGSICRHGKNYRRDHVAARVFAGLEALLTAPAALNEFLRSYTKELAAANQTLAQQGKTLDRDLNRIDREIENLVTAITNGLNHPSIRAKLDELEARKREVLIESERPLPGAIVPHVKAEALWRKKSNLLLQVLEESAEEAIKNALRGLVEKVTLIPDGTAKNGFALRIEGQLTELLNSSGRP